MRCLSFIILTLSLVAVAYGHVTLQTLTSSSDYYSRGLDREKAGKIDEAIGDFTIAIELDEAAIKTTEDQRAKTRLVEAYFTRAEARLKDKRDLDGAIDDFTRAIALNPKYALAYRQRGFARQLKNDKDGAATDFAKSEDLTSQLTRSLRAAIPVSSRTLGPTLPEGVIAQIGDDYITLSMVSERRKKLAQEVAKQENITIEQAGKEISKYEPELIVDVIKEQFITQEVLRLNLSDEIERQLSAGRSSDPMDRERRRLQIVRGLVLVRLIGSRAYFKPSSTEVKQYFDKHPEKFRGMAFEVTAIRERMFEEWGNARLLEELVHDSYLNVAEQYRAEVLKHLTEAIQIASDIPGGNPIRTKGPGQLSGEFIIGCFVVPILTRGEAGVGPCAYKEPLSRNPALDHYHRAVDRFNGNDFTGAIKEYTKALSVYPDFARAYLGRAMALLMLSRDPEAEEDLRSALYFDPALKKQIEENATHIKQQRPRP